MAEHAYLFTLISSPCRHVPIGCLHTVLHPLLTLCMPYGLGPDAVALKTCVAVKLLPPCKFFHTAKASDNSDLATLRTEAVEDFDVAIRLMPSYGDAWKRRAQAKNALEDLDGAAQVPHHSSKCCMCSCWTSGVLDGGQVMQQCAGLGAWCSALASTACRMPLRFSLWLLQALAPMPSTVGTQACTLLHIRTWGGCLFLGDRSLTWPAAAAALRVSVLQDLQQALKLAAGAPDAAEVHLELGVVYRRQRNYRRSVQACRTATQLDPSSQQVGRHLKVYHTSTWCQPGYRLVAVQKAAARLVCCPVFFILLC